MPFTPYATTAEFKTWVVLTDGLDDTVIGDVLNAVSRWIDEYTDRHFWQDGSAGSEVARTFVACHYHQLNIDDLVSVLTFKTDEAGDGTFETTWSTSDYQLLPVNRPTGHPYISVEAVGARQFPIRFAVPSRADRVQITGIWGWVAVPSAVKQACLIQSSRVLKRRHSPEGVAGFGDFGAVRISSRLDPDVQQLLDPYRRYIVLVA